VLVEVAPARIVLAAVGVGVCVSIWQRQREYRRKLERGDWGPGGPPESERASFARERAVVIAAIRLMIAVAAMMLCAWIGAPKWVNGIAGLIAIGCFVAALIQLTRWGWYRSP
jgi:hypothetical protein